MRFLVLTDKYFPHPYANAICAQELIKVWLKQGHTIDVLAYEDFDGTPCKWEGNQVYYVRPDKRLSLFYYADTYRNKFKGKMAGYAASFISKLKGIILLPWHPFYSFSFPNRIYHKMCEIHKLNEYDAVIAILSPIDSSIAACRFKQKYSNIPYVVFCVDSLRKAFVEKYIGKNFADGFFWEKKILEKCDAYFYMQARRNDYAMSRYNPYRNKLRETDLPRLKFKDCAKIQKYNFGEEAEHWVYAGSIGGLHYNPNQMIEVFNQIAMEPKRILHLYTRGPEANRIADMAKIRKWNIIIHDYVDAATLESIMATADVIVSLKTSNQISAKIFECMSYGKIIVHFSGHPEDPNVSYLEKYALGKIVKLYDDIEKQIVDLKEFLQMKTKKQVDMEVLKKIFEMSTPEYSALEIEKVIMTLKKRM